MTKKWSELSFVEFITVVTLILIFITAVLSIKFFGVWLLFELLKRFNIIDSYTVFDLLWGFLAVFLITYKYIPKNKD